MDEPWCGCYIAAVGDEEGEVEYCPLRASAPDLLAALEGFVWLGNNLHNIKADPDRFREFYESALKDATGAIRKARGEAHEPSRAKGEA